MFPLVCLACFSITSGFFLRETLVGIGSAPFAGPMGDFVNSPAILLRVEFAETPFKVGLVYLSLSGFIYFNARWAKEGNYFYFFTPSVQYISVLRFFHYRWCLDLIYSWYLVTWF